MSHSENNLEKQKRRHSGPLIGFVVVLIFAAVAGLFFTGADDIVEQDATEAAADDI